jgi:hypothetical protein
VLDALRNGPVQGLSVSEIMADAQIGSRDAAYQLLHRMTKDGEIARLGRGKYALPVPLLSGVSGSHDDRQAIDETEIKAASDTPDTPDRGAPANPAADAAVVLPLFPPTVWRRIHKGVKAPAGTRWRVFPNGIGVLYARFSLRLDIKSLRLDGKQRWVEESLHTTDPKVAKANLDALRLRRIAEAKASAHP